MVVWVFQVKFEDETYKTSELNFKPGTQRREVEARIRKKYGASIEIVNVGVRG